MHETVDWIYLSPHLDDVVLSCGGMIWQQIREGNHVQIWTVFAGDSPVGDPPVGDSPVGDPYADTLTPFAQSLHQRWQSGIHSTEARRQEDMAACRILQVDFRHFEYPDCIYRKDINGKPVIGGEEDLFQSDYEGEQALVEDLVDRLKRDIPTKISLAVPFGFGNHIDHQLVHRAALMTGLNVWLYADFPYSAKPETLQKWLSPSQGVYQKVISPDGLSKWQEAVSAYKSQLSTFWKSTSEMQQQIADYCRSGAGSLLRQR